MREYPSISNIFRINSASSINLLEQDTNYKSNGKQNLNSSDRNNGCDLNKSLNSISDYNGNHKMRRFSELSQFSPFGQDGFKNSYFLWIVTPVAASLSVAIVIAALAGPQWLLTEEKLPNANYNGTTYFRTQDDGAFITKTTKSSLWILCSALQGAESYNCIKIDYFSNEEYRTDPLDSTLAIPYTITKSCPFFMVSGIFLIISFIVFLVPTTVSHRSNLYYFSAGILFIVSGLLMLIGLIVYISIFKAEIGSKLRPKSTLQPPLFKFAYGYSFFLYVFGFMLTEFVGVLNIFLYISLQQFGPKKENLPCFSAKKTNHEEKNNQRVQLPKRIEGRAGCKKHSTNLFIENDRIFFLEKAQRCDLHSKNLAKSLNELYTEPAPTYSQFDLPQEFPLTRSVSTTTEIFSNSTNTLEKKNKKNQTNYTEKEFNDICGIPSSGRITRGIRKTKDELFNEFCKRAGMRPKPKDIYYIDEPIEFADEDDNVYIVDDNYSAINKNLKRRNSFVEPIRKQNSNISLRSTFPRQDKIYPKSLFDLDRCESEIWSENQNLSKNSKLHDYMSNSRTLPRSFMKRNINSYDFDGNNNPSGNRISLGSRDTLNSCYSLHKSCDNINSVNFCNDSARKISNTNLVVQWPAVIPGSPSNYSVKSYHCNNVMQGNNQQKQHSNVGRTVSTANANSIYRRKLLQEHLYENGNDVFDAFDLDEIERSRRKSHASLFGDGGCYDMINGTAV